MVHPINGDTALGFIDAIADMLQSFYIEGSMPITDKFYWYFPGKVTVFPEEESEEGVSVSYPKELVELLNNNL